VGVSDFDGEAAKRYMNPHIEAVQQRTLAEMRRQNEMSRLARGDVAMASKAYGGGRGEVLEGEAMRGEEANMYDFLARSNASAYENAQGQFERDRAAGLSAQGMNQGANLQADTTTAGFYDMLLGRNLDAGNRAREFGAAAANDVNARNAGFEQQTGLANQDLEGRFRLSDQEAENQQMEADAARRQESGRFNMDARNRSFGANADRRQDASRTNAGFRNEMAGANADRRLTASRDNAQIGQSMLDRMLRAGAQMGEIGDADSRFAGRDIMNLLQTGGAAREAENERLMADYEEFLRMQDAPMDRERDLMAILSGTPRDVRTTSTGSSKSSSKTGGGVMNSALGLAQLGLAGYSSGIFGGRR
ncbi:MAG TPA: hypothetical protein VGR19_08730, partial [Allosphingosinicella sp.]|nr:hypothetical protein [Allosphingosinicella sp.]